MKILYGTVIGAIIAGILTAIASVYISLTSNNVGDFGVKTKDIWWLFLIVDSIVGLVIGGIVGFIASLFNLSSIKIGVGILIIATIPMLLFYGVSQNKFDKDFMRFGIALVIIALITGTMLPLITAFLEKPK